MPLGDGEELGLTMGPQIPLRRCPHCGVANPTIARLGGFEITPGQTASMRGRGNSLIWHHYACQTCGGTISGATIKLPNNSIFAQGRLVWIVPALRTVASSLPHRVAYYLAQAQETLTSPSASVVMSAAAVDAILKDKGYKDGSLHARIEKATEAGVITQAMALVAHDVRLDANAERHVDESEPPPSAEDAQRCYDFAEALAELIFILPARVKRQNPSPATPGVPPA
jgi:hypothetical protein